MNKQYFKQRMWPSKVNHDSLVNNAESPYKMNKK